MPEPNRRPNSDANVSIFMKGLGIAHHVEKGEIYDEKWEFLFIRGIDKHNLKIVVKEFRDGLEFPVETVYPIPAGATNIEIETTDSIPIATGDFHHKPSSNFSARRIVDDDFDSRWIIDLSEDLHRTPVQLRRQNGVALTLLTITDAVFYTASVSKRPYIIKLNDENSFSRYVGQWMGFDIKWKANMGQTAIRFHSDLIDDIVLERDPKILRYEIEINNDCCACELRPRSDFHYYYDLLVDMADEVFDEDVSLPTSRSSPFLTSFADRTNIETSSKEIESLEKAENFAAGFFALTSTLLGGKEDDCHLVQVTRLDGIDRLEDLP